MRVLAVFAAKSARCPEAKVVSQYVSGTLDEDAAAAFGLHLEKCLICQRRVDEEHDSLLTALRHPPAVPESDETILNHLMERAKGMPPGSRQAAETVAEAPPATVSLEDFVACLLRSGLADAAEVEQLVEQGRPADTEAFVKFLVQRRKLTPFQARTLAGGQWQGLVLGNYVLLEKLGQGGMGTVFKAQHRRMSRVVCLKVLHASHRESPGLLERFRREAQTVAALQHPNIVVAHDADEADGVPFLVMEFIAGRDLAQRVAASGPLPSDEALDVALQTARALDHAHRRGVIHRDIKPHNLLVDDGGIVKILDMGLARFDSYLSQNSDATTHASMTISGVIMGTVDYMAPEQALNSRRADHRSDIYSLGCTLYFLLTGKVVFGGETLMEKLVAHREQPAPSLRAGGANVSGAYEAVFRRMVAKDPRQRYATMAELVEDLDALRNGYQPKAALDAQRGGRRLAAAAAALAAAVLALWLTRAAWLPDLESGRPKDTSKAAAPQLPQGPPRVGHPQTRANGGPGRVMLILAHDWFIEDHYTSVASALKSRGVNFVVASSKPGSARPKHDAIPPVPVDLTLDKFDVNDFDSVIFPGSNPYDFTKIKVNGERVRSIVTACLDKGKPVAAMECAIMVLDDAGITSEGNFEQMGGCWIARFPKRRGVLVTTKDAKYADDLVDTLLAGFPATLGK